MKDQNPSGMRPALGDEYITLPITFDYHGGRKDSSKSRKLWAAIISVVGAIIAIGLLFSDNNSFLVNLVISAAFSFALSLIIRFLFLREKKVRNNYKEMFASDLQVDDSVIWGIYCIEDTYPYICRFRNGKSAVFIGLNKDVILGKYEDAEFEHYEAIGDAYNLAGASKVQVIHMDYMDNVGTDDRIEQSFISLAEVSNPDLKNLLTEVYSYQQEQMMQTVTTFDVYAFLWSGSDISAWNTIQRILSCFLDANYRSYHVLTSYDLRELTKVVFNLEEFSVVKASSGAFETTVSSSVTAIKLVSADGSETKLGKTRAERAEEARQAALEQAAVEQERKRRRKRKSGKKPQEEEDGIDIFSEE